MLRHILSTCTIILFIFLISCQENPKKDSKAPLPTAKEQLTDSVKTSNKESDTSVVTSKPIKVEDTIVLDEDNAIPFFFEYSKEHKENKVKISTKYGDIVIELFDQTPYHRANFIYLTKKGYFNGSSFHRVVKDFIIQGGSSDNREIAQRRGEIGKYLLPPDTDKGLKHHRGVVSMPSSDNVDNPHKLASPYEFFIVVKRPGAYHLDGKYTVFGKVIQGMDVVDKINQLPTDSREWPYENVRMEVEIVD